MSDLKIDQFYFDFMEKIANLPRHLVSEGYDDALELILEKAKSYGFSTTLYEFPTGLECFNWIIPEKWSLKSAVLKNKKGETLLDSSKEPLCCMSYSTSFEGWVGKDVLFEHLYTHPVIEDAVPFVYSYYKKRWGLCCSERFKKTLNDDQYYVHIDSVFEKGHLKVGEIVVDGCFDESFILESHLCHPHQLNDGPIGAILGLDLLKKIKSLNPRYTYRQLIVPEMIGTAAWCFRNKHLIPKVIAGLFIEMLTIDNPIILNQSFKGDTLIDQLFSDIVRNESPDNMIDQFNYGNDERFFNGANINIPMLAIHRSKMSRYQIDLNDTYPEYHSNQDNMSLVSEKKLLRMYDLLCELLFAFDRGLSVPKAKFYGEPFLSRYGLHTKDYSDFCQLMDALNSLGDNKTLYEISKAMNQNCQDLFKIYQKLEEKNLLTFLPYMKI